MFDKLGVLFWPVGTGDSTTFVVREDQVIFQVDLRHTAKSEDEETDCAPILDQLEENLPTVKGSAYLSSFALTHPDQDHIKGFEALMELVDLWALWITQRVVRKPPAEH